MAYETPVRITYGLGSVAFSAGATATAIKPPKGKKMGRVVDIHLRPSITFNQVTTPAYVRVGTTGTPAKYAELNCGAAAATDAYNLTDAGSINANIDLVADGVNQVEVVTVAMTGGTPAGTGLVDVTIDWF